MRVALVSANPEPTSPLSVSPTASLTKRVEVGEPWYYLVLPSTQDYRITVRVASVPIR